jgi:hypothetical protein
MKRRAVQDIRSSTGCVVRQEDKHEEKIVAGYQKQCRWRG